MVFTPLWMTLCWSRFIPLKTIFQSIVFKSHPNAMTFNLQRPHQRAVTSPINQPHQHSSQSRVCSPGVRSAPIPVEMLSPDGRVNDFALSVDHQVQKLWPCCPLATLNSLNLPLESVSLPPSAMPLDVSRIVISKIRTFSGKNRHWKKNISFYLPIDVVLGLLLHRPAAS